MSDSPIGFTSQSYGPVVQVVNATFSASATGTTTIPNDNTIPQNTEGDQYMTLAITPKSTSNTLIIDVIAFVSHSAAVGIIGAIFQDSTANALAAGDIRNTVGTELNMLVMRHIMTAGTTSATTFNVRIGGDGAGTTTFNGSGGAQLFSTATKSSIVIMEYRP